MANIKVPTIIRILGMKDKLNEDILKSIVSAAEEDGVILHVETCIGGAGLQPIRMLSQPKKATWVINDKESKKSDLYDVVYRFPTELATVCKEIESKIFPHFVDKADNSYEDKKGKKGEKDNIHAMILSQIQEIEDTSKADADKIIQAAITMLDYAVTPNKTVKQHFDGFSKKIGNIRLLHYRFADVHHLEITNEDLFDVIKKYGHRKNVILYIDPPYYLTNGCYSKNMSDHDSHEKLAELLHKTKCKWVLFCRSQASRSRNMHQNSGLVDDSLRCFYENHYLYKGCYYKKWIDHKTEELVITNFEFKDCDFYGKSEPPQDENQPTTKA